MDVSRVRRGERIAIYGGILLVVGLFLPWYHVHGLGSVGSHTATHQPDLSGWTAHPTMRWLLLLAAIAPLILAWIIANDYALSWPRGQLTSVVAIAAFGLIGYVGVIQKPGDSNSLISLKWGWLIAFLGPILMLVGSVMRQSETEVRRKPPGSI